MRSTLPAGACRTEAWRTGSCGAGKGCGGMDTVLWEVHEHSRMAVGHRSVHRTVCARQPGMAPYFPTSPRVPIAFPCTNCSKAKSVRLVHPKCSLLLCVLTLTKWSLLSRWEPLCHSLSWFCFLESSIPENSRPLLPQSHCCSRCD